MSGLRLGGMKEQIDTNTEYKEFMENLLKNLSIPVLDQGKFVPLLDFANKLNTNLFEDDTYIGDLVLPYTIMTIKKNDMFYMMFMFPFGIGLGEVKLDTAINKRGVKIEDIIWLQIPGVEEGERIVSYNENNTYFNGSIEILDFIDNITKDRLPNILASMGVLLEHECEHGFGEVIKNYRLVGDKFYNKDLMKKAYGEYRN